MVVPVQPLVGRVVIVTGGSRGIGRAISQAYAASGATVVVASRKQEACDAVVDEIGARGGTAVGMACHVGHWEDCDRLVEEVHESYGRIDVLVNNAGMSPLYPSVDAVSEALYDKVFDVNLKGAWRLSVGAGRHMVAAGRGAVLNVSSIAALQPGAHELPYAMAKAGLNTLTVGLARAFAPAVRVNCLMLGPIQTDVADAWTTEQRSRIDEVVPLGRVGLTDDVVEAAMHLTGDGASYTTGAVLKIDGGLAWSAS